MAIEGEPGSAAGYQGPRSRSFGSIAAEYAAHRPDYPAAAVAWALEPLADRSHPDVLDLAAGTGKLTAGLLTAAPRTGRVFGGEPDPAMRAEFARRLPGTPVVGCTAERIPVRSGALDAVVVGQAFHWFDPDRALGEIARVLRPGGVLAVFGNDGDFAVDWVAEHERITHPDAAADSTDDPLPLAAHPLFGPPADRAFAHRQRTTAAGLTATVATHSRTLLLPDAERASLLARTEAHLHGVHGPAVFDFPLVTRVRRMRRQPVSDPAAGN
ncbi:methyltransferase family protein [Murinocardiopsis flavida]|uniref:Methyltransferase family protein n=1 Tax=Murinocardiopsis flavida TaxID=645275 RepID=A0A2P8D587_9ACTN|nr:class I SAM-dependent methyltransferase [Murinocardiopsis flavida]PSK92384.1 methyltransferase family protein [Murinocardiopsis flavida]